METLTLYPRRWKLIQQIFFYLLCLIPAWSLAFQTTLFGGMFGFHALYDGGELVERIMGGMGLVAVAAIIGDTTHKVFWPEPVVTADETGITVKKVFIPWHEYRSVAIGGATVNGVPVGHVAVQGARKVTIQNALLPDHAEWVAKKIEAFAQRADTYVIDDVPPLQAVRKPSRVARNRPSGLEAASDHAASA